MIQYKNRHLTVFQSALYQTTSSVIETGDLVLLVDPTWLPHEVEQIKSYVYQIKKERPLYLLFTHSDWDHILGYKAFPDAITIGSQAFKDHPEKEAVIEQIKTFDDRNYLTRGYEIEYPDLDIVVDHDGQTFRVGETVLTFYLSPGHIVDGLFTIVEPLGIFIAGDYLSDVEFPFMYYSSEKYEQTLEKVDYIFSQHHITHLIPGHGQVTDSKVEMMKRKEDALHYIRSLRTAVLEEDQIKMKELLDGYAFPRGLKGSHEHNQELLRKEINKSDS